MTSQLTIRIKQTKLLLDADWVSTFIVCLLVLVIIIIINLYEAASVHHKFILTGDWSGHVERVGLWSEAAVKELSRSSVLHLGVTGQM